MQGRKLTVLVLLVLTLIIGGGAIAIGLQLQGQPTTTPEDTSAAPGDRWDNGVCNIGIVSTHVDVTDDFNGGYGVGRSSLEPFMDNGYVDNIRYIDGRNYNASDFADLDLLFVVDSNLTNLPIGGTPGDSPSYTYPPDHYIRSQAPSQDLLNNINGNYLAGMSVVVTGDNGAYTTPGSRGRGVGDFANGFSAVVANGLSSVLGNPFTYITESPVEAWFYIYGGTFGKSDNTSVTDADVRFDVVATGNPVLAGAEHWFDDPQFHDDEVGSIRRIGPEPDLGLGTPGVIDFVGPGNVGAQCVTSRSFYNFCTGTDSTGAEQCTVREHCILVYVPPSETGTPGVASTPRGYLVVDSNGGIPTMTALASMITSLPDCNPDEATPTPTPTTDIPIETPTPTPTPTFTIAACGAICSTDSDCRDTSVSSTNVCFDHDNDGVTTCVIQQCANPSLSPFCSTDGCAVGDPPATPTPTTTGIETPTPSPTSVYTPSECSESCDPAQGTNACVANNVCRDSDSNGTYTCILETCDASPTSCNPDFCSVQSGMTVTKSASQSCGQSANASVVSYSIVITNPEGSDRTVNIVDTLDPDVEDSYVIQTSIVPPGGLLSNGVITWTGMTVPANGSLTLNYQVQFPSTTYQNQMSNTVVVTEGGVERGRDTFTITPFCSPSSALISDEVDRIILAMVFILAGMLMYRLGLHEEIGMLLWDKSGKKLFEEDKRQQKDFEEKVEDAYSRRS